MACLPSLLFRMRSPSYLPAYYVWRFLVFKRHTILTGAPVFSVTWVCESPDAFESMNWPMVNCTTITVEPHANRADPCVYLLIYLEFFMRNVNALVRPLPTTLPKQSCAVYQYAFLASWIFLSLILHILLHSTARDIFTVRYTFIIILYFLLLLEASWFFSVSFYCQNWSLRNYSPRCLYRFFLFYWNSLAFAFFTSNHF